MFPPSPKLKINELPHHERLGNANGCQNSNSENIKEKKSISIQCQNVIVTIKCFLQRGSVMLNYKEKCYINCT